MKYRVDMVYALNVTVEIEADDKDDAVELAIDKAYITAYAGNGGSSGKLVGTSDPDVYVEAGDCPFEGEVGKFEISCEELSGES